MLQFITWDVTPEIIEGQKIPNLYGLLFVTGLILGYFIVKKIFKKEGIEDEKLDKLVFYIVLATILGARLGHVFFYGPYWDVIENGFIVERGYLSHPADIFKVWEGGLASHGAAIMIFISLWIYSKKVLHKPIWWMLDRIAAPAAIASCFIRLGNLVNSEIVGIPTDVSWAFSFPHYYNETIGNYDPTPRHPAQLYEAIAYFCIFGILMYLFYKKELFKKPGKLFGVLLILVMGARFFVETIKVGQTTRDAEMFINTGQMLSIPFVLIGIYLLFRKPKTT